MADRARMMEAEKAAEVLEGALKGHKGDLTIADAAARSGLPLRDAELGLHFLSTKYHATLSATDKGELLYRFPRGFSVPLTQTTRWKRFWGGVKRAVTGAAKFVLRAWIAIALIGYVAIFLALAIALAFAGKSSDRDDGPGFEIAGALLRVVFEALYWTFHPFSPFAVRNVYDGSAWDAPARRKKREDDVPFYEKVNRFVFGPTPPPVDPREMEKKILAEIRIQRGRIGLADVLRVTGLSREEADPLMARLMLDYEGEVNVSDDGGITYSFPALRRTAGDVGEKRPPPVWNERVPEPKITGNPAGSNVLIAALNGFNLFASFIALSAGLTIEKLFWLFEQAQTHIPIPAPDPGVPLVLGVIPFVMSLAIFAAPLLRALTHGARKKEAETENARRAVLRTVIEQTGQKNAVHEEKLARAWEGATGKAPTDKEIASVVTALGGDVDVDASARDEGRTAYRFRDLEAEARALAEERAQAAESEREVGAVVYRS